MALLEALYPLTEISRFRRQYDDDFIDRMSNRHSMFIFIVLGIIISTRQYVGDPINCWAPAQFTHEWIDYTNRICWISNTYYVPLEENIPDLEENKVHRIQYYQWVPIMIFIEALFFFVPSLVWEAFNTQSGIHVNKIVSEVTAAEYKGPRNYESTMYRIVRNLDKALRSQREYRTGCLVRWRHSLSKSCFLICGKRYGNYLTILYLFVKVLYIGNAVGQLFLLDSFLGDGYLFYGVYIVKDLVRGKDWTRLHNRFPRITMCDFKIRNLGNRVHDHTVQCALPINLFNEKVFMFIWFWLVFIAIATTMNLASWIWTLFRRNRAQYVRKYLKIMHRNFAKENNTPSKEFCEDYLRQDGIFILRLIAKNTNDVVVGEIIQRLWEYYKQHHKKEKELDTV